MNYSLVSPFECYDRLEKVIESSVQISTVGNYIRPEWEFYEFAAESYDFQQSIPIPAIGTLWIPVLTVKVPVGQNGIIEKYNCNFTGGGFIDGSGDLIWQLTANGAPIKNYEAILTERGSADDPRTVAPIRVYSNQVITFQVKHTQNAMLANGFIICGLAGYFYPST